MKKVYIAGKITGVENYREIFSAAEQNLKNKGMTVMNPAALPYPGFSHSEYMHVCESMIDICDIICFLPGWMDSKGATYEFQYASNKGKRRVEYNTLLEELSK